MLQILYVTPQYSQMQSIMLSMAFAAEEKDSLPWPAVLMLTEHNRKVGCNEMKPRW